VLLLSVALTVAAFLAYWQIKQMEITWYIIVAFIIIGFMVAFAAMFGFDKLLKYFEKSTN
jgi:putative effector of murein hydrolase